MIENILSQTDLSLFAVVYKGSCNLEGPGSYGVSHLLEHLMCKNFEDLHDDFEEYCINWNAFTSNNEIVFYISGLEEDLSKFRDKWYKRLTEGFIITPAQFDQEKKIVLQEYSDTFINQGNALNLIRQWYGNYQPIGLREDLVNLTYKDMLSLQELIYAKPNQIINISPTWECKWENKLGEAPEFKTYSLNFSNSIPLERVPETDKSEIYIFTDINEDIGELNLIAEIMCGGLQSTMYKELREKLGLCYYVSFSSNMLGNTAVYVVNSSTTDDNVEAFVDKVNEIFTTPEDFVTEDHYKIMIEKIKRKLKQQDCGVNQKFYYLLEDPDKRYQTVIENISYPKVLELIKKHFSPEKWTVVIDNKYTKGRAE